MGFAVALYLCCLESGSWLAVRLGVGFVHRLSVEGFRRVHLAVAHVAVVRNGEHLAAGFLCVRIHVIPKLRRILALERWKRDDLVHLSRRRHGR